MRAINLLSSQNDNTNIVKYGLLLSLLIAIIVEAVTYCLIDFNGEKYKGENYLYKYKVLVKAKMVELKKLKEKINESNNVIERLDDIEKNNFAVYFSLYEIYKAMPVGLYLSSLVCHDNFISMRGCANKKLIIKKMMDNISKSTYFRKHRLDYIKRVNSCNLALNSLY